MWKFQFVRWIGNWRKVWVVSMLTSESVSLSVCVFGLGASVLLSNPCRSMFAPYRQIMLGVDADWSDPLDWYVCVNGKAIAGNSTLVA